MSRKSEYALIVDSRGNRIPVIRAEYEGAKHTRTHPQHRSNTSHDAELAVAGPQLRDNARALEENHDLAKGVLDELVRKTIGTELIPEPRVRMTNGEQATDVNEQLSLWWTRWAERPEATKRYSHAQSQRLGVRNWFRDGEHFDQLLTGSVRGFRHSTEVPFSYEMLESDFVPFDYYDPERNVVQGAEKNGWGEIRAWHMWRQHPGDVTSYGLISRGTPLVGIRASDLRRVPAERILQLHFFTRLSTRGVSVFASIMNRMRDIKDIDQSERVAARVAAYMAWYIKRFAGPDAESTAGDPRLIDIEEGAIIDSLSPGDEIGAFESNRPNPNLDNFRSYQLKNVAAGAGTGYSPIAKDWGGSWSSQRMENTDMRANYGILLRDYCDMREKPIYQRFASACFAQGLIRMPSDVDRATLLDVSYTQPETPYVNPEQGINADLKELGVNDGGIPLNTWANIVRRRGNNPAEILRKLQEQQSKLDDIRLTTDEQTGQETGGETQSPPSVQAVS